MRLKIKNRWLIAGFLFAMLLAYKLSISKTLETKNQINDIEEKMLGFEDIGKVSSNLQSKERYLDSVLLNNNLKNNSVQNSLLDFLNTETSNESIKIIEFLEPHSAILDEVSVVSYQFTLQGEYIEIEQILHQLEQQTGYGKISHLSFQKKRDFRRRRDYLLVEVIVENYDGI